MTSLKKLDLSIGCLVFLIGYASAQFPEKYMSANLQAADHCVSKPNCHDCIQTSGCAWCFDPNMNRPNSSQDMKPRCFTPAFDNTHCPEEYTYNPDNIMSVFSNLSLSKAQKGSGGQIVTGAEGSWNYSESSSAHGSGFGQSGGSGGAQGQIVQVAPQRISLKLRAKQSYSIFMDYTQAEDYPVDLYYLMDLSKSMQDDKEKLSLLGDKLAHTMQSITSNFRLGFGSFVDKVVMPYVSTLPEKLEHPCPDCVAPYGFRNHLSLSTNTKMFSHMVKQANVSGNLDAPEGGFDAIMQAVVCRNDIGWREQARRLLVFSTDAGFHYAGDGKLGGIVKPNDGECHLDNTGYYTHSILQDYPSVSQINHKVKTNSINVIFAVTAGKLSVYENLKTHIEGASSAKLSTDSSNIVELIKEQYEQISSSVEMKHNASSHLNIKFFTKCLSENGAMKETSKCSGIKVGDVINFMIQIEVTQCPKDPKDWLQTIQIYPVGINESLVVDLEMLCSCPCEHPGDANYIERADFCHSHGTYKCGICDCEYGSFGRFCECSSEFANSFNMSQACIQPGSPNGLECNGRGSCICGKCDCGSENFYGTYCECNNFSCERHNGQLCSGPTHGHCECGHCQCNAGWSGDNCACSTNTATCFAPDVLGENKICSGHGVCECGVCKCEVTEEGRYSGKYCEKCPTCADRCEEFKECVMCQQYDTGPLKGDACASNCTKFTPIPVDTIVVNEENNEVSCAYYDEDDCRFAYIYYFGNNGQLVVKVQQERECPPKVFLLGIILGVVAAIVLMGLAIVLLWKLFTTIHDRREFAKFEKERMMAKWDTGENPIYKQATSTFKNPTYAGKS